MRTRRQALGQHFLHHQPTIDRIVQYVEQELVHATEQGCAARALLEIGPGKLAMTRGLEALAQERNLPFLLVERDRLLEEGIREGTKPTTELHFMDAATERFAQFLAEQESAQRTPVFVASNLPYSASSQILANLCHQSHLLSGCVVMVQKELADRMAAKPGTGDRGSLSLLIQSYFHIVDHFDVGPGAFSPPPKVKSTVLKMRPLRPPLTANLKNPRQFETFCKQLFSGRRKMVRNLIPKEKHELFPKLGISGTERPETLELSTVLALFKGVQGD